MTLTPKQVEELWKKIKEHFDKANAFYDAYKSARDAVLYEWVTLIGILDAFTLLEKKKASLQYNFITAEPVVLSLPHYSQRLAQANAYFPGLPLRVFPILHTHLTGHSISTKKNVTLGLANLIGASYIEQMKKKLKEIFGDSLKDIKVETSQCNKENCFRIKYVFSVPIVIALPDKPYEPIISDKFSSNSPNINYFLPNLIKYAVYNDGDNHIFEIIVDRQTANILFNPQNFAMYLDALFFLDKNLAYILKNANIEEYIKSVIEKTEQYVKLLSKKKKELEDKIDKQKDKVVDKVKELIEETVKELKLKAQKELPSMLVDYFQKIINELRNYPNNLGRDLLLFFDNNSNLQIIQRFLRVSSPSDVHSAALHYTRNLLRAIRLEESIRTIINDLDQIINELNTATKDNKPINVGKLKTSLYHVEVELFTAENVVKKLFESLDKGLRTLAANLRVHAEYSWVAPMLNSIKSNHVQFFEHLIKEIQNIVEEQLPSLEEKMKISLITPSKAKIKACVAALSNYSKEEYEKNKEKIVDNFINCLFTETELNKLVKKREEDKNIDKALTILEIKIRDLEELNDLLESYKLQKELEEKEKKVEGGVLKQFFGKFEEIIEKESAIKDLVEGGKQFLQFLGINKPFGFLKQTGILQGLKGLSELTFKFADKAVTKATNYYKNKKLARIERELKEAEKYLNGIEAESFQALFETFAIYLSALVLVGRVLLENLRIEVRETPTELYFDISIHHLNVPAVDASQLAISYKAFLYDGWRRYKPLIYFTTKASLIASGLYFTALPVLSTLLGPLGAAITYTLAVGISVATSSSPLEKPARLITRAIVRGKSSISNDFAQWLDEQWVKTKHKFGELITPVIGSPDLLLNATREKLLAKEHVKYEYILPGKGSWVTVDVTFKKTGIEMFRDYYALEKSIRPVILKIHSHKVDNITLISSDFINYVKKDMYYEFVNEIRTILHTAINMLRQISIK